MADPVTVTTPDFTGVIDQSVFIRPLGGPQNPLSYLDRFPDEVYQKGIDSHLVRFLYALLGPAGIGWLRRNYLEARLKLEDFGLETFDLDAFYGDPLQFGRIFEEQYDEDPRGTLPRDRWEELRAKDAKYRNRAIDFVNGARAGNTAEGMHLVARSGLGHEVEIVEQYRYIYDQLSDDPLGIPNYGQTDSTEEIVVVPRRELPQSEKQVLRISGSPTGGTFKLFFPVGNEATNMTAEIAYNASRLTIQQFLEAIPTIGQGNIRVTGGPLPDNQIEITFTGALGYKDVPKLQALNSLTGGTISAVTVSTDRGGIEQDDEVVDISPRDKRYLLTALSRIKPVTTIVTFGMGSGTQSRQIWNAAYSASTLYDVVRYVTGNATVAWPKPQGDYWIEASVEHEAPRVDDPTHHYRGFHNVVSVDSYTEATVADPGYLTDLDSIPHHRSDHIGSFTRYQQALYPVLNRPLPADFQFTADRALADYAEPLTVLSSTKNGTHLVNGIYPVDYQSLPGVPPVKYKDDQFWASVERTEGDEYLEIDLGEAKPVNYVYFEILRKPLDIAVDYDVLDLAPERQWQPVTYASELPSGTYVSYHVGPAAWQTVELWFNNRLDQMIYTRFLRLKFSRRADADSPFVAPDGTVYPFSVEVRNLRVGRNVS